MSLRLNNSSEQITLVYFVNLSKISSEYAKELISQLLNLIDFDFDKTK